ncbi:hypothetical protein FQA39_LY16944 [Lamprigera yunnana]|nr:hypothetical protein FQA39_LY16944 [Lamprigera yunnana]
MAAKIVIYNNKKNGGGVRLAQGPSSANKGPYRPLSPRVGPVPPPAAGLKPRQVIVSSPGSPSSSSDSQSGSDSVKHCLPSRVNSPALRVSPSSVMRKSPSVTSAQGIRNSPSASSSLRNSPSTASVGSPGTAKHSPSVTSLSRASPSITLMSTTRSSSPAMQGSSAGLNITLNTTTPSFATLSSLQSTISNINTTANNIYNLNYTQPPTYASTNPFLTGAYLSYTPSESMHIDKYNTTGSSKDMPKQFSFAESTFPEHLKYNTLNSKTSYDTTESMYIPNDASKFNTIGSKYQDKSGYLCINYGTDLKYNSNKASGYDISPSASHSNNTMLLSVEDTPTPTSSIETEDSNTREVGEKDVEGDGEQSD